MARMISGWEEEGTGRRFCAVTDAEDEDLRLLIGPYTASKGLFAPASRLLDMMLGRSAPAALVASFAVTVLIEKRGKWTFTAADLDDWLREHRWAMVNGLWSRAEGISREEAA
jgi:hypothetical protein